VLDIAGRVEDDDPELAAVQRRAGAADQWAIKRAGVVRHQQDGGMTMLTPQVVG
jgi:hypothetical protein